MHLNSLVDLIPLGKQMVLELLRTKFRMWIYQLMTCCGMCLKLFEQKLNENVDGSIEAIQHRQ